MIDVLADIGIRTLRFFGDPVDHGLDLLVGVEPRLVPRQHLGIVEEDSGDGGHHPVGWVVPCPLSSSRMRS